MILGYLLNKIILMKNLRYIKSLYSVDFLFIGEF